jgi:hypothetical protein
MRETTLMETGLALALGVDAETAGAGALEDPDDGVGDPEEPPPPLDDELQAASRLAVETTAAAATTRVRVDFMVTPS